MKANFTITFEIAPAEGALALTTTDFKGVVGQPLTGDIGITGGKGAPYTVVDADVTQLPPGVAIDSNGAISGTPTQEGSYSVGISVADSDG